jgi:outer membrane protein TolC
MKPPLHVPGPETSAPDADGASVRCAGAVTDSAQAASDDARFSVRARELALTADVTAAYLTLTTAAKTAALQAQNAAKARLELKFTQDRYRSGAVSLVDVTDARAAFERAESDRINAVFDYHKAFAALESAVGRPLR